MILESRVLVVGSAEGDILSLEEGLSFWGAVDPLNGQLIDRRHPQFGANIGGRIVLMERSIGSSSGSAVLLETLHRGVGPAAIILGEPDQILTLGAIVAREMGYANIPVVQLATAEFGRLRGRARIDERGLITLISPSC